MLTANTVVYHRVSRSRSVLAPGNSLRGVASATDYSVSTLST